MLRQPGLATRTSIAMLAVAAGTVDGQWLADWLRERVRLA
jgi:hypothetical protein